MLGLGTNKNSASKMLPWVLETWRHLVAMRNPTQMFFYRLRFKNDGFSNDIWLCEKTQTFYYVLTTIHWVKPDEPILLTSSLLMGALPGDG